MIDIKYCLRATGKLTMLKFFPVDPIAQGEIAALFQRMIAQPSQLDWVVETLVNHVGEWPGPKEIRGLICSQFKPLDGIETYTSLAGFSPADCEARNLEKSERFKQLEQGYRVAAGLKRIGA